MIYKLQKDNPIHSKERCYVFTSLLFFIHDIGKEFGSISAKEESGRLNTDLTNRNVNYLAGNKKLTNYNRYLKLIVFTTMWQ